MKSLAYVALAMAVLACDRSTTAPFGRAAAPTATALTGPPKAGDLAPDFTLSDHTGKAVTLSKARGQKVVLVFYRGHW